ncbi:MAG TPA: hypothetical protein PLJ21_04725 [Pseudobdellovibrionaceae bacterium]|nr:hypothetical protein [Pseudobdellovibrionaceae bacterium]
MNILTFLLLSFVFSPLAFSQAKITSKLVSPEDSDLTIKTLSILPFTDNLNGVYAKPLEQHMNTLVQKDSQWSLINKKTSLPPVFDLSENQNEVLKLFKSLNVDALIWGQILKGPSGLKIKNVLFSKDGNPLTMDEVEISKNLSMEEVLEKQTVSYSNLKKSLPYAGLILARKDLNVTLNLGSLQGLRAMDEMSIIQILKIHRHPVKKFMVSNEKEVIGKIKIIKVEPTLSFAQIIFEKESGFIVPGSKILSNGGMSYSNPVLADSQSEDTAFGEKPKEWRPPASPQFGKVTAGLGLTNYELSQTLRTSGAINTNASFSPGIQLGLEVWLNPSWYLNFTLRQIVLSTANPLSNSSPSKLNLGLGQYAGLLGYNFLGEEGLQGSTVKFLLGASNTEISSSGSTPVAITTMNYSGFLFRLESDFLVETEESQYTLGLGLDWHFFPRVTENYSSGSSSTNRIYSFDVFLKTPWKENTNIKYDFKIENYNSEFSGTGDRTGALGEPASNTTHSIMSLNVALEYLF